MSTEQAATSSNTVNIPTAASKAGSTLLPLVLLLAELDSHCHCCRYKSAVALHRKDKHEGRKAKSALSAKSTSAAVTCPYCKKKFKHWQYLNVHKKKCAVAKIQFQVSPFFLVCAASKNKALDAHSVRHLPRHRFCEQHHPQESHTQ